MPSKSYNLLPVKIVCIGIPIHTIFHYTLLANVCLTGKVDNNTDCMYMLNTTS